MKICPKCVLPIENNHCSFCNNYKKSQFLESDFTKLLKKNKNSKYDCLVMCSGGKDSISSLYYIKEKYKLNPLVFTFDNGYEFEQAIGNVKEATQILNVDWIYKKSINASNILKHAIKEKQGFSLCFLCSLWYMQEVYEILEKFDITLVISGYTKGQLNDSFDSNFNKLKDGIEEFVEKNLGKDYPKNYNDIIKRHKFAKKVNFISPHWFLGVLEEDYEKVIKDKLNWKPLKHSYPKGSTNCKLNILGSKNTLNAYGYTHFHIEKSKQINEGVLTKKDALEKLDEKYLNTLCDKYNKEVK